MAHALLLALFDAPDAAARAARELRGAGVVRERVSIVTRSDDGNGALAAAADASPGAEMEDSLAATRLGELGAHLLAAVALVLPGIGPIVADGPLAAGLGEAAGHNVGGLRRTLERAGLTAGDAGVWVARIEAGAVLVGAHVGQGRSSGVESLYRRCGATHIAAGTWPD